MDGPGHEHTDAISHQTPPSASRSGTVISIMDPEPTVLEISRDPPTESRRSRIDGSPR